MSDAQEETPAAAPNPVRVRFTRPQRNAGGFGYTGRTEENVVAAPEGFEPSPGSGGEIVDPSTPVTGGWRAVGEPAGGPNAAQEE